MTGNERSSTTRTSRRSDEDKKQPAIVGPGGADPGSGQRPNGGTKSGAGHAFDDGDSRVFPEGDG
jgi:hypothetical protein